MATDPTYPTPATVKRLFAVSGNSCAFPGCKLPLVDVGGKVTGRICHIEGSKSGAARHNASQTDEERRAFENIVLMCPIHHDVIDADVVSYTVKRLMQIKQEHENEVGEIEEPEDSVVSQFLANISGNTIVDGSLIFTQNQMGGQVAHSITNVGPQPRAFSDAAANQLITSLKSHPPETFSVESPMGDAEALMFGNKLKSVLISAGWAWKGSAMVLYDDPQPGIAVFAKVPNNARNVLCNWLQAAGFQVVGALNAKDDDVTIWIGSS
jgi:hypothetical protein